MRGKFLIMRVIEWGSFCLLSLSTIGYKKSSLRLCATYGRDFIVSKNNSITTTIDVTTTMDVTGTIGHENNRVLGLSHEKVS
jgi:hypothetical protein